MRMAQPHYTGKKIILFKDNSLRAAEVGSVECGKILLDFNADIDALNFSG
jgi:hypothetical protein